MKLMNLQWFNYNIVIFVLYCWTFVTLADSEIFLNSFKTKHIASGIVEHETAADSAAITDHRTPIKSRRGNRRKIFRAIWNLPNSCGDRFGIELPLADFGIEFNSNHQWTHGNVVNIFYHTALGMYPYYKYRKGSRAPIPINGGLPQLGNISHHLERVAADIFATIPDPNFDGLGIIDWEKWRPQWLDNFDELSLYRKESKAHVQRMHPKWDNATRNLVAEMEWTEGAKLFMESTLKMVKALRPNMKWGYYAYPYCFNDHNTSCTASAMARNNQIMWLFNESSAIYPSIYLRPTRLDQRAIVRSKIEEAFRVRERSSKPKGVVMSYTRFNYSDTGLFYNLEDLNNTILQSAELGTHGVIFWGDNVDDNSTEVCKHLQSYIKNALGPTVLMSQEGAESCSDRVCSGKGRCVGDILTCGSMQARKGPLSPTMRGTDGGRGVNGCTCRCFKRWGGNDCSKRIYN